ncbi:isochorismatase family cysteine hydrolase [Desulfococcaceae bacterium HSG8]|nr:isochorismatase family cysteine hydrolase [Desulfococcaceae bacterium HSG8]
MTELHKENPAILIIDLVKDNFDDSKNLPITSFARRIIPPINRLTGIFREKGWPVVFSTDAFNSQDFIFTSRMKPHSLAGTPGAEIADGLDYQDGDYWLPKPRFSAFFKTGLENWLRERDVTCCAVAGIATHFCVLTTVMDALCHDFKAILLEDCTASYSESIHEQTLSLYRRNPLYPLLSVASSTDLITE